MATKKTGVELEFSILDDDFSKTIKEMNSAISSMKKELNLENEVLKNSGSTVTDYKNKIQTLKEQEELSKRKVDESRLAYEKVKNIMGENSVEATKYKNKLIDAEIEHQKIKNEIDKTTKSLESQETALKENEKNNQELNSTLGTLTSTIKEQKNHLEDLKKQYISIVLEQGKNSTQAKNLKSEIKNLNVEINSNELKLGAATNELKKFTKEEENAGKQAITFGELIKANLISDAIKKGINEIVSSVKQLGSQLLELGKESFNFFADYEQLVGGVVTLFKDSSLKVQENANNAYKTSGLTANKYMETVTSFSASLLQGLNNDTAKAAQIADMAIIDMSDNANKMGTDMTLIQNAYQGFAKQNYTMLDNLKLGYGGTKTEMERLLVDAEKLTGIKYDINNLSDVYSAIHSIQGELGITGTTAKEASTTIQGSVTSMKSSWQNLLTGMADENANHKQLVSNFVNSIIGENGEGGVLGNIIPRIKIIVEGAKLIFQEFWKQLPKIGEQIPELKPLIDILQWIKTNGPIIISVIAGITASMVAFKIAGTVTKVISGFQTFFSVVKSGQGIMAGLNLVMNANPISIIVVAIAGLVAGFVTLWKTSEGFRNFWVGLWDGIVNIVKGAIDGIKNFFTGIIDFIKNNWQGLLLFIVNPFAGAFKMLYDNCEGFRTFVDDFVQSIISFFQQIPTKIGEFVQSIATFFQDLISRFLQFGVDAYTWVTIEIPKIINGILTFFGQLPEKIGFFIGQVIGHILKFGIDAYTWATTEIPKIIDGIISFFQELPGKIWGFFVDIFDKTTQWGSSMIEKAKEVASNFLNNVITFFQELPGKVWNFISDVTSKVATWGLNLASKGKEYASNFFNNVISFIKQLPSKIWTFLTDTVSKVVNWGSNLASKGKQAASNFFNNIVNTIKGLPSEMLNIGKNLVQGLWNGISNTKQWITDKIKGFGKSITDGIKNVFGIHSPSTVFRDEVGKNLALGLGNGFTNEMKDVTSEMQNAIPKSFDIDINPNTLTNGYNNNLTNEFARNITDTSDYDPGEVAPIYLNIEHFENNREQDIEDLSEELEFYRMKATYGKGNG